jgi:lysophospholipase L1-like esterase
LFAGNEGRGTKFVRVTGALLFAWQALRLREYRPEGETMNTGCLSGFLASFALLATPLALAQHAASSAPQEQPVGMVEHPCPPPLNPPASVRNLLIELFIEPRRLTSADFDRLMKDHEFAAFNQASQLRARQDWAGLCRFRAANDDAVTATERPRVVFMGDSITENWGMGDPELFQHGVLNRGISGQTTPQMLVRFRSDVIALEPRAVHILAGTNDVAGNTGPNRPQDFKNNIMSMAELARAHGIHVILGSIPPAAGFNWRPQVNPVPLIRELNQWLREYASQNGFDYVDYYSVLARPNGELKPELSNDGVHPNRSGYRLMRKLMEPKISSGNAR